MSLHNLPVSTSLNPDHILEHSEDDTKSLFVIIKVSFSFYSLYEMLLVYPAAGLQRSHSTLSVCLTADHQWPHVFPRHSEEGVWLTLEKLHSRQEVHGKQGELEKYTNLLVVCFNESFTRWFQYFAFLLLQLLGKKQHIRALLIDRILLQHEVCLIKTLPGHEKNIGGFLKGYTLPV